MHVKGSHHYVAGLAVLTLTFILVMPTLVRLLPKASATVGDPSSWQRMFLRLNWRPMTPINADWLPILVVRQHALYDAHETWMTTSRGSAWAAAWLLLAHPATTLFLEGSKHESNC